jgi:hypothetical protein
VSELECRVLDYVLDCSGLYRCLGVQNTLKNSFIQNKPVSK